MAIETHVFDEDGDLLLLLSKALEREEAVAAEAREDTTMSDFPSTDDDDVVSDGDAQAPYDPSPTNDEVPTEDSSSALGNDKEMDMKEQESNIEVHMLVSSKHMMLASPVFRAMLRYSNFKEGLTLQSTGKVEVPLPDDDPVPFIILLNIIHGRNRQASRQVDLKLMTGLSKLVDKYQMQEAVEIFSDIWFDALKADIPENYDAPGTTTMNWLAITWVFRKSSEFTDITRLVEQGGDDRIEEDILEGIPIPEVVIETIKQNRKDVLFQIYAIIEKTLKRYQRQEVLCPRSDSNELRAACDAMMPGSLLKSAALGGVWPPPKDPYVGFTFSALATQIRELKITALCDSISRTRVRGAFPPLDHGLQAMIRVKIEVFGEHLLDSILRSSCQERPMVKTIISKNLAIRF